MLIMLACGNCMDLALYAFERLLPSAFRVKGLVFGHLRVKSFGAQGLRFKLEVWDVDSRN